MIPVCVAISADFAASVRPVTRFNSFNLASAATILSCSATIAFSVSVTACFAASTLACSTLMLAADASSVALFAAVSAFTAVSRAV